MIDIAAIERAAKAVAPHVRHTPVMPLTGLQRPFAVDGTVIAKLECLQVTGSFKARGAMNRLLATPPERLAAGFVTASGGNHGLAVARTAAVAGVPATVFLPGTVSPSKVAKLKGWGAVVTIIGEVWDQSNAAALDHARRTGAEYVHPFADPVVVAGQGTLGLEILADIPDVDTVIVAIGGGGLITGLATAIKARRPSVRIVGVEPTGSPTLHACMAAGACVPLKSVTTRVATMACRQTDPALFAQVQPLIDTILLVSDDAMLAASRRLWFEAGVAADLSGAASIAALAEHPDAFRGDRRICALVCGAGPDGTTD